MAVFTRFLPYWHVFLALNVAVSLGHVVHAIYRGLPHAQPMMVALLIAAFGLGHDVVIAATNISSLYIMPYTIIATILLQGFITSKKFSSAMDERDAKSQELLSTYRQLDDELLRRETLEAANQRLERENEIAAQQLIQADKLATMGTMVAGLHTISPIQPA